MLTLISGTNRPDSNTRKVTAYYEKLLKEKDVDFKLLDLLSLPGETFTPEMYANTHPTFQTLQEKYLFPAEKFILVMPEYNGGFPGVVKTLIDVSNIGKSWRGTKMSLTGVASGRAGNLRGMDALTNMLHYIGVSIFPNKLPLSLIDTRLDEAGNFNHQESFDLIQKQLEDFMAF